jgi:hypothetical protein
MSDVHIFTAPLQPATRFVDRTGERPMWFRCKPRRLLRAECCYKDRWAKYVRVQVYWDGIRVWCAPGHGCKKGKP